MRNIMTKPELIDFDLTEADLKLYQRQVESYKQCREKIRIAQDQRNKYIVWFCIAVAAICFLLGIIFIVVLENSGEVWGAIFLILAGVNPYVIYKLFYINDYFESTPKTRKIQNFEASLGFPTDKSKYVNAKLEEKVQSFQRATKRFEEYKKQKEIDYWKNLNGYQFEEEIANLYRKLGYDARVTNKSGDGGVDIILQKDNIKIAVQCKHHSVPIGPHDVRALMGVVAAQSFERGIFVSLCGFTQTVYNEVKTSKVLIELISLQNILQMVEVSSTLNAQILTTTSKQQQTSTQDINTNKPTQNPPLTRATQSQSYKPVVIGSKVTFRRASIDKKVTYRIMSYSDLSNDIISAENPIALALLYHKAGDTVTVKAPNGDYEIIIVDVEN